MIEYHEELTLAWYAFCLYLSEIERHEHDAETYRQDPACDWLRNSQAYIALARYRAAKWLIKFIRLTRQTDGFVFMDGLVYVEKYEKLDTYVLSQRSGQPLEQIPLIPESVSAV
jgi:hypothetical protein